MPQHLEIEIGGVCVAKMTTNRLGGTNYKIDWDSNFVKLSLYKFDTCVECQPEDSVKSDKDFRNDFIHARRAIAAASKTAKLFLYVISEVEKHEDRDIDVVQIRLRTNKFDRGKVTIEPKEGEIANLRMEIGTGPVRKPGTQPAQAIEFNQLGIDSFGATSSLELALQVLDSEGPWMLKTLLENI